MERIIDQIRVPVCLGGGVKSLQEASRLMAIGADKIILNSGFFDNPEEVSRVAEVHGKQFMVLSLDWARDTLGTAHVMKSRGKVATFPLGGLPWKSISEAFGEVMLRSIERDGTGNGLDMKSVNFMPADMKLPVILAGGIGKPEHIIEGLATQGVSGVATANLLNFIGESMGQARQAAIQSGANLASFT